MIMRFFFKHKVQPEHWGGDGAKLETEESLTAFKELNNMFINSLVPLIVCDTIRLLNFPGYVASPVILQQFVCIDWTSRINVAINFVLIFISYRNGPAHWKKVAPWLYLVLNMVGFVIIPSINICWTMYTITKVEVDDSSSYLLIWVWFYTMFSIAMLASYFLFEKRRFTDELLLYIKLTEAMKEPDFEE